MTRCLALRCASRRLWSSSGTVETRANCTAREGGGRGRETRNVNSRGEAVGAISDCAKQCC
eukprot:1579780-Rhodomonas_salina.1